MRGAMEVLGGIDPTQVHQGGTVYEIAQDPTREIKEDDENGEYVDALKEYAKMECLGVTESSEEVSSANVPFQQLALKMTNLVITGKVKKRILRKGYGTTPTIPSTVKIHYNVYIECEALPVDSTYGRKQPFSFILGNGDVIDGLDVAVSSMLINEKSEFLIHPDMAYKNSGLRRIPPNSTVLFEIEILDTINVNPSESIDKTKDKTFSVVYDVCKGLCAKGKRMFGMQDYTGAVKEYETALYKLENALLRDYSDQEKSDEMMLKLLTNLLVCHTHLESPKRGCTCANKIFNLVRNHEKLRADVKVYYNNAKCLQMLGDFKGARKRLQIAKRCAPQYAAVDQELERLDEAEKKYQDQQKAFGNRLFR